MARDDRQAQPLTLVWDWPLRCWHWAFAGTLCGSLVTGLAGDITLMDWHLRLGYTALGLLLFRVGWACWGSRHARFASFRTSPARMLAHFRGADAAAARTAPGAALVMAMLVVAALQALTGLATSDEIFTEGPLVRHLDDATVDLASALHHRLFWVILVLVGVHLAAHGVYAARRDPTWLSMFSGRKAVALAPAEHRPGRALATAAAAAGLVWWGLSLM